VAAVRADPDGYAEIVYYGTCSSPPVSVRTIPVSTRRARQHLTEAGANALDRSMDRAELGPTPFSVGCT